MAEIAQLKTRFETLRIDRDNLFLYERLLDLDRSIFKPIMRKILDGELDIEDTRPIFSVGFRYAYASDEARRMWLIDSREKLAANVSNRLFDQDRYVKEFEVENVDEVENVKSSVIEAYEARTGETLSASQRAALAVAVEGMMRIDYDAAGSYGRRLSDLSTPGPSS